MAAAYKLTSGSHVLRALDGASIPADPENRDYQEYQVWLSTGNTPDPADPVPLIYTESLTLHGRVRTTDATPTQLLRWTLNALTGYDGALRLLAVDAGNGVIKKVVVDITLERLSGGALLIGQTIQASHQSSGAAATTSNVAAWAISGSVSGSDAVITVTGAAGRTVDWLAVGEYSTFVPAGR